MSYIDKKISNSKPTLIKTRKSLHQLPCLTVSIPQRRQSEDFSKPNIPSIPRNPKLQKPIASSPSSPLSPSTQKLKNKSKNLNLQIKNSLSSLKSVNSDYIQCTQDMVQGLNSLQKGVQQLKSEFKDINLSLVPTNQFKSITSTPKTEASCKKFLVQGKYKTKACKALNCIKNEISALNDQITSNEKFLQYENLQESWDLYKNMMTADTIVDNKEKNIECQACVLF